VADIPITRNHTVAKKPVMANVFLAAPRNKTTGNLSAAHKIPGEAFGWEVRWDNYFQSRRSAYEPFGGFRSW
jgi:hypothetical protein